jgi:hypothetical protein
MNEDVITQIGGEKEIAPSTVRIKEGAAGKQDLG